MNLALRFFIIIIGSVFTLTVIYFLLKRKLSERNSIPYVFGLILIIILIVFPDILDFIAFIFGIDYPPALLFLFSSLYLFVLNIRQTIQLSIFSEQIRELSQHIALKKNIDKKD